MFVRINVNVNTMVVVVVAVTGISFDYSMCCARYVCDVFGSFVSVFISIAQTSDVLTLTCSAAARNVYAMCINFDYTSSGVH